MVAEVIVDISSSEIDRIFDYEIGSLDIGAGFLSNRPILREYPSV